MATFTWDADFGATASREQRIKSVNFGDGYEQRQADGINPLRETWSLNFTNRDIAEIDAIEDFLLARGGVENFDWTPPRASAAAKYVCKSWQRTAAIGVFDSLTATFERVYEA